MKSVEQTLARDLSRRDKAGQELGRLILGWSGGPRYSQDSRFTAPKPKMARGELVKASHLEAVRRSGLDRLPR